MEPQFPSRTEAYNTLKDSLNIPRRGTFLNRKFFHFFFREEADGLVEKIPKERMTQLIKSYGIIELNQNYYCAKEGGKEKEAEKIKEEIFHRLKEGMEKLLNHSKNNPYFVK